MSVSWIYKLNESDGRLHKEDVLRQALSCCVLGSDNSTNFLSIVNAAYDPYITFGVKQVPTTSGITGAENPWDDFIGMLSKLALRQLSGNAARDAIDAMSQRFDSDEWNGFCANAIKKDLRCGISDKTINKVVKGTPYEVPVFSCQLATDSTGRPEMAGKKRLEKKLDGVRVLMVIRNSVVTCFSRNGKVFENFKHIEDEVTRNIDRIYVALGINRKNGVVLDGEVMGKSFQDLMRQARRKTDADASDSVFHVFDYLPLLAFNEGHWNKQQRRRLEDLQKLRGLSAYLEIMDGIEVDLDTAEGHEVMDRFAKDSVAQGYEGIMIKELEAPYLCKRGLFWMKWKPTITVDLPIVALEEGTGKNVGKLGAFVCEGVDNGKTIRVNVGSGFSDVDRDSYWTSGDLLIGRVAEVLCDAVTQNQDGSYSLRFPRFVRFRDDKA